MILPLQNYLSRWYVATPRYELQLLPVSPGAHSQPDALPADTALAASSPCGETSEDSAPPLRWTLVLMGIDWAYGETLLTQSNPAWDLRATNARDEDEESARVRAADASRPRRVEEIDSAIEDSQTRVSPDVGDMCR